MKTIIALSLSLFLLGCAPQDQESSDTQGLSARRSASPARQMISFDGRIVRFEDLHFRMITWVATFETTQGQLVKCRLGSPSHPLFKRLGLDDYDEIQSVKDFSGFPRFRIEGKKSQLVPDAWELTSWRVIDSE